MPLGNVNDEGAAAGMVGNVSARTPGVSTCVHPARARAAPIAPVLAKMLAFSYNVGTTFLELISLLAIVRS